ncbi:hypothetical protein ACSBR2_034942 [Camellia fascicularis]
MTSVCISTCVNDARVPSKATYMNLDKWQESDAESVKTAAGGGEGRHHRPTVVESISCRQLYMKSYTFSRKETVPERTKKCLDRVGERVVARGGERRRRRKRKAVRGQGRKRSVVVVVVRRVKELSCAALCAIFHKLLYCTASVDVVDHREQRVQL